MSLLNRTVEGLFFECSSRRYWRFEHFGLTGETGFIECPGAAPLGFAFIPAASSEGPASEKNPVQTRGTVFYCPPAEHNMMFHLPQIVWLVASGYQVMMFDWHGAGMSEGRPTIEGIRADARCALNALLERKGITELPLYLFGQGMGACAALSLLENSPVTFNAVVLESLIASYRGWMLHRYGPGIGHLCAALLPEHLTDPVEELARVRIPLALVIPGKDQRVPEKESDRIVREAPAHREIWRAEKKKSLGVFDYPGPWRERFLAFCEEHRTSTSE